MDARFTDGQPMPEFMAYVDLEAQKRKGLKCVKCGTTVWGEKTLMCPCGTHVLRVHKVD